MAITALSDVVRAGTSAFAGGGGGGATLYIASLTINPAQMYEASSSIAATGVTDTSKVFAQLMPNTDWEADELAGYTVVATPSTDSITFAISGPGPIGGTFDIIYQWS